MKCKTWTCSLEITPGPQNLHSKQVFIKLLPIPWVGRFYTEEVRWSAVATFLTTAPINFYSSIFEDMFYLLGLRLPPPLLFRMWCWLLQGSASCLEPLPVCRAWGDRASCLYLSGWFSHFSSPFYAFAPSLPFTEFRCSFVFSITNSLRLFFLPI